MDYVRRPATVALLILVTACAAGSSGNPQRTDPDSRHFDVIARAELEALRDFTALEAITQLRPRWLRGRGPSVTVDGGTGGLRARSGEERVRAYVDGISRDLERLDMIATDEVASIRFLNSADATTPFGIGHAAGAILVTTRTH